MQQISNRQADEQLQRLDGLPNRFGVERTEGAIGALRDALRKAGDLAHARRAVERLALAQYWPTPAEVDAAVRGASGDVNPGPAPADCERCHEGRVLVRFAVDPTAEKRQSRQLEPGEHASAFEREYGGLAYCDCARGRWLRAAEPKAAPAPASGGMRQVTMGATEFPQMRS